MRWVLDKDLDRLQQIESDAFDRVQAALEDQLPVATSEVARQLEWTAVIIIFLVVLVGFGGVQVYRNFQRAAGSFANRIVASLKAAWAPAVAVAIPMILITIVIQAAYVTYYTVSDRQRLARLDNAAAALEGAGDFKAAATLRRRAFALNGTDDRRYRVSRDIWLADVTQSHRALDVNDLLIRYEGINASTKHDDGELEAAHLYLRERVRDRAQPPSADLVKDVDSYRTRFLNGSDQSRPFLGKLVLMARISLHLDDNGSAIVDRLGKSAGLASELETKYRLYAQGLLIRAQLQAMLADVGEQAPVAKPIDQQTRASIAAAVSTAANLDADLARIVKVTQLQLPPALAAALQGLQTPNGNTEPAKEAAKKLLSDFVDHELLPQAQVIFRNEGLARVRCEKALWPIIRRDLGERELKVRVATARSVAGAATTTGVEQFNAFLAVADQAQQIDEYAIAEVWLKAADDIRTTRNVSPDQTQKDRIQTIQSALRAADLKNLFLVL